MLKLLCRLVKTFSRCSLTITICIATYWLSDLKSNFLYCHKYTYKLSASVIIVNGPVMDDHDWLWWWLCGSTLRVKQQPQGEYGSILKYFQTLFYNIPIVVSDPDPNILLMSLQAGFEEFYPQNHAQHNLEKVGYFPWICWGKFW